MWESNKTAGPISFTVTKILLLLDKRRTGLYYDA